MSMAVTGWACARKLGPHTQHRQHALGAGRERERTGVRGPAGTQRGGVHYGDAGAGTQRIGERAGERQAGGAAARDHDVVALDARTHCPLPRVWS